MVALDAQLRAKNQPLRALCSQLSSRYWQLSMIQTWTEKACQEPYLSCMNTKLPIFFYILPIISIFVPVASSTLMMLWSGLELHAISL